MCLQRVNRDDKKTCAPYVLHAASIVAPPPPIIIGCIRSLCVCVVFHSVMVRALNSPRDRRFDSWQFLIMVTSLSNLMPPQQHLYNGLARPADCFFLPRNGLVHLGASPHWYSNGLAHTDSMLAYGHHGWPTGQTSAWTTGWTN